MIHAGRLVDVGAGKVLEDVSVITSDEKIIAVQEGFVQVEAGQELIDLSRHVVLPGLMDMHTHITNVITPEFYTEQYTLGPADWALRATVYTEATLMAGFTTIRDLGDQNDGGSIALRNAVRGRLHNRSAYLYRQSRDTDNRRPFRPDQWTAARLTCRTRT